MNTPGDQDHDQSTPTTASKVGRLHLPPMTRGTQMFSMLIFFLLGGAVIGLIVGNPFGLSFLPGGGGEPQPAGSETAMAAPTEGESLYQCPMHPEVVDSRPGECPICGMDLMPVRKEAPSSAEREILYWYAPMDPTYIRDEPGLSPMGMELVPKYADHAAGAGGSGEVRIDPVQVQNIGVVTSAARTERIARRSNTVGILDFNAEKVTWINTKFEGWLEKVLINYVGQEVRKGEPLFEIYSPELVTTQEEYLRALEYKASLANSQREGARQQAESLLKSSRERLRYWDISEAQIEALEISRRVERRITVTSPVDGTVAEVMQDALEGMRVRPGMNLYKIADLSTVWVHADVYESDLPWIRKNQPAIVSFRNDPGRVYRGTVLFLYPEVSRETRTLKLCVEMPNPGGRLRPGMYADVVIEGPPLPGAVVVPQSAVIRTGERSIIFVGLGDGRFDPREVTLGIHGEGDSIQVLSGIREGEMVVTQAQFMLDSESRIQEAIAKYRARGEGKPDGPEPGHPEHLD